MTRVAYPHFHTPFDGQVYAERSGQSACRRSEKRPNRVGMTHFNGRTLLIDVFALPSMHVVWKPLAVRLTVHDHAGSVHDCSDRRISPMPSSSLTLVPPPPRGLATFALVIVVVLLTACAAPQPRKARALRIERVDQTYELGKRIGRVVVDNPYGEINVRPNDEAELAVHAVIQRLPPDFARLRLRIQRSDGALRLAVVGTGHVSGRADLSIYVPPVVSLDLSTRAGRIAAPKRIGPVRARSESGPILVASRSGLDLQSTTGVIKSTAWPGAWAGPARVRSDTGQIVLYVPISGNLQIDARTHGAITSGFGLTSHVGDDGVRAAHARYGSGRLKVDAVSRTGEIVLEPLVGLGQDVNWLETDD